MHINFNWITENAAARGHSKTRDVVVSKTKGGSQNGVDRYAAAVVIPEHVMKLARFVVGDRVVIGVACNDELGRCLAIKRVVKGGHKIGPATSKTGVSFDGNCIRGRVQFMWPEDMHEDFVAADGNAKIMDDGILLVWEGVQ